MSRNNTLSSQVVREQRLAEPAKVKPLSRYSGPADGHMEAGQLSSLDDLQRTLACDVVSQVSSRRISLSDQPCRLA
jgi:hypothetical protein